MLFNTLNLCGRSVSRIPFTKILDNRIIEIIKTKQKKTFSTSVLDVNTNVVKDVLLFRFDNDRQMKLISGFGVCQFIFWNYLAEFGFTSLKDVPVTNKDGPWYTRYNLGSTTFRWAFTCSCILLGNGLCILAWLHTIRTVKSIVLLKGGKYINLITYKPFGKDTVLKVPLTKISATESRVTAKTTIPIKVDGKRLFYIINMTGKFGNTRLFDATIGVTRMKYKP